MRSARVSQDCSHVLEYEKVQTVLQSTQTSSEHLRTLSFQQRSEIVRKSSQIFGSRWDVSGNLGYDKVKISLISLRKKLIGIILGRGS